MYAKIIMTIMFLMIFTSFSVYGAENELYLDSNNFCSGYDITFTLWNKSQWQNKDALDDEEIDYFEDVEVTIYDGPIKSLGVLAETQTNNISEFEVSFSSENNYLIEIDNMENFNSYKDTTYIENCDPNNTQQKSDDTTSPKNITLSSNNNNLEITLTNTTINQEEIEITSLKQNTMNVNERIQNVENIFDISINSEKEYNSMEVKYRGEKEHYSIYEYDESQFNWNILQENSTSPITISLNSNSILGFTSNTNKEVSNSLDNSSRDSNISQELSNQQNSSNENSIPVIEQSSNSNLPYIVIGIIVIIVVLLSPLLFKNKKHKSISENHSSLSSYRQEYEKTKEYVLQYRDSYDKEAIRQALVQGNVPKDIIDKVLSEIYL